MTTCPGQQGLYKSLLSSALGSHWVDISHFFPTLCSPQKGQQPVNRSAKLQSFCPILDYGKKQTNPAKIPQNQQPNPLNKITQQIRNKTNPQQPNEHNNNKKTPTITKNPNQIKPKVNENALMTMSLSRNKIIFLDQLDIDISFLQAGY